MVRELRSVTQGKGYRVDLAGSTHAWTLDEPRSQGGGDTGPTPVEAFLGALLGCLVISFRYSARRAKIPIERIEGWIAANEKRYIEQIAVELQVWSSAPEADVRALLPQAERGCFVRATLRPDLRYSVELAVYPPAGAGTEAPGGPDAS